MSFGKWIGGALGWAMGGPIGGIIGFAIGAMADDKSFKEVQSNAGSQARPNYGQYRHQTQSEVLQRLSILAC